MKVLFVLETLNIRGQPAAAPLESVMPLLRGLAGRHDVQLVTNSPDGPATKQTEHGVVIHRLRQLAVPGSDRCITVRPGRAVGQIFGAGEPEVVHLLGDPGQIGRAAAAEARRRNLPVVVRSGGDIAQTAAALLGPAGRVPALRKRAAERLVGWLNRASLVVAPSQAARDRLLSQGLSTAVNVVPTGVEPGRFGPQAVTVSVSELRRRYKLPDKPLLLASGPLTPAERFDIVLRALPVIRQELDIHAVIAGDGPEVNRLKRLASQLGVADRIHWFEGSDDEQLAELQAVANLYAVGTPDALESPTTLAAMAGSLPVVAADAGCLPELCHSGRNGYLFLSGDPNGLAQSAIRILRNPAMAEKMGAESRRIATQEHDLAAVPDAYLTAYRQLTQ